MIVNLTMTICLSEKIFKNFLGNFFEKKIRKIMRKDYEKIQEKNEKNITKRFLNCIQNTLTMK